MSIQPLSFPLISNQPKPVDFSTLPNKLMVRILDFLGPQQVSTSQVCKHWAHVCKSYKLDSRIGFNLARGIYCRQSIPFEIQINNFKLMNDQQLICSNFKNIYLYSNNTLQFVTRGEGFIRHLIPLENNRILFNCNVDSKIHLLSLEDGQILKTFVREDLEEIVSLKHAFATQSGKLITCYDDNQTLVWDLEQTHCLSKFTTEEVNCAILAPNQEVLITGHASGKICFWNLNTKEEQPIIGTYLNFGAVSSLLCSDQDQLIVAGNSDEDNSVISVFDLNRMQREQNFEMTGINFKLHSVTCKGVLAASYTIEGQKMLAAIDLTKDEDYYLKGYDLMSNEESMQGGKFFSLNMRPLSSEIVIYDFSVSDPQKIFQNIVENYPLEKDIALSRFLAMPVPSEKWTEIYNFSGGKEAYEAQSPVWQVAKIKEYLSQSYKDLT
jgi:WD40 repeat protein